MRAPLVTNVDAVGDLAVIGGGLIGLACAAAAAERGLSVTLLTTDHPGAASRAGAGLLVPHYSGEGVHGAAARFLVAARDLYPAYVRWVATRSGVGVPFCSSGAIELARTPAECEALYQGAPEGAVPLTAPDVARLEPALGPTAGGLLYPRDGAVDNVRLTDALWSIVRGHARVRVRAEAAVQLDLDERDPAVITRGGARWRARRVLLAAGAWSATLQGLPRPLPVRPVRGQICVVRSAPLRHVVLAPDAYMVGRGGDRTLVGSSMEDVGYNATTTATVIDALRRAASLSCPALGEEPVVDAWSGLRPVTPDLLPILGPDPEFPAIIYATGHSRNGILLAPITADVTSAIAADESPGWDLSAFGIDRFERVSPSK